jgi:F-type H+-transporting ATPase subunit delta
MASALANRYAQALADVVTQPGAALSPDSAMTELAAFWDAFRSSAELRSVLLSPAVAPQKKRNIVASLGARFGMSQITRNFLNVVMDHRRLSLLGDMLAGLQAVLDERNGVVRAEVITARPADAEDQNLLTTRLNQKTGRRVAARFTTDPALLGGAVLRVGSTIYDGSVKGQLAALRKQIAS